jgi:hypothetical protein
MQRKQEERQEESSKAWDLPRRQMNTKELSKRKRDNSHHREKNLTEETREKEEREEKSFFLLLGRKNAKQKQSRSRKCFVTKHTSASRADHCLQEWNTMQQQQTGTPLIGTYHRRGEYKKQKIVAQARPWR